MQPSGFYAISLKITLVLCDGAFVDLNFNLTLNMYQVALSTLMR
jgi:hypothetical protein